MENIFRKLKALFFNKNLIFIIICILGISLKAFKFNIFLNLDCFYMFHVSIEILFIIFIGSTFLITAFSVKYSKSIKEILLSSLFLFFAILNTIHIYLTFYNNESYGLHFSANITYVVFTLIFLLSALIPDKKLNTKSFIYICIVIICLITSLVYVISNSTLYLFSSPLPSTYTKNMAYYIILEVLLLYTLNFYLHRYKAANDIQAKYNIKSILFLICSLLYLSFMKHHNDFYSITGHILKAFSIFYMFSAYFLVNVRRPYEELKRAKQIVDEANDIKTDFIVNLSHELRTPVNIILNAVKLIKCDDASKKYIRSIEKGTERLNKVCESIIEFNEIENGNPSYSFKNLDMVFLIDEILEAAEEIADSKNLDIGFDFSGEHVIKTDISKLKIILLNLISNIIKYAPMDGLVHIRLNIKNSIVLSLVNNGPNIPEEDIENIFKKFYKSKCCNIESTEGLGIGLYIASGYSKMLGGNIDVINADGITGYRLTLPFIPPDKNEKISSDYNISGFFSDIS